MLSLQVWLAGWLLDGWRSELVNRIGKDGGCCLWWRKSACAVPDAKEGAGVEQIWSRAAAS
jgi:hypothetical protein